MLGLSFAGKNLNKDKAEAAAARPTNWFEWPPGQLPRITINITICFIGYLLLLLLSLSLLLCVEGNKNILKGSRKGQAQTDAVYKAIYISASRGKVSESQAKPSQAKTLPTPPNPLASNCIESIFLACSVCARLASRVQVLAGCSFSSAIRGEFCGSSQLCVGFVVFKQSADALRESINPFSTVYSCYMQRHAAILGTDSSYNFR